MHSTVVLKLLETRSSIRGKTTVETVRLAPSFCDASVAAWVYDSMISSGVQAGEGRPLYCRRSWEFDHTL